MEVTGTSLNNVITEVSGSYLRVHMRDGNYHGNVHAKVYVTYVKVDKLSASSAGSIFFRGVDPARYHIEVSASARRIDRNNRRCQWSPTPAPLAPVKLN